MEHVGIVVDDLAAAAAFFVELGLRLQGEGRVEGGWVDRVVGLESVRAEIAMVETPDGHGRLELTKFHAPSVRLLLDTQVDRDRLQRGAHDARPPPVRELLGDGVGIPDKLARRVEGAGEDHLPLVIGAHEDSLVVEARCWSSRVQLSSQNRR